MIKEVYLCLDNDDAGECASKKIASKLKEIGISSYRIKLPEGIKDINEYILREGNRGDFDRFIKEAQVLECTQANLISKDIEISEDDTGITFNFKGRRYRIRGLSVGRLDQLKVNIKLTNYSSYHIDTIDLYSAKARGVFIAQVKKVLNIEGGILEGDLLFIVNYLEEIQGRMIAIDTKGEDRQWKMSEEEKKVAVEYLRSEDLLEDIIKDFKACGYIGEESNLILGYLVSISRKLSTPLAVLVVSRSAAGKSTLQDAILSFTPQEDYEKYTRLTDQALFY
jgi:hypothetical protein